MHIAFCKRNVHDKQKPSMTKCIVECLWMWHEVEDGRFNGAERECRPVCIPRRGMGRRRPTGRWLAFAACGAGFYFPKGTSGSVEYGGGPSWQGCSRRCCTIPFVARLAKTTGSEGWWVFILCGWHCVVAIALSPEELVRKGDGGWGGLLMYKDIICC